MAGFDLSEYSEKITENDILKQFGPGCREEQDDSHTINRRYFDPRSNSFIQFGIEDRRVVNILVTNDKISSTSCVPKNQLPVLETGRGIRVGDTLDKILKTYGTKNAYLRKLKKIEPFYHYGTMRLMYSCLDTEGNKMEYEEICSLEIILKDNLAISIELITGE
jgi:hypothetical protein